MNPPSDRDGLSLLLRPLPFAERASASSHAPDERADAHVHVDTQRASLDADGRNAVFDPNRAYFAREEITLLHSLTSGVPGRFGPSECEPEPPENRPIELAPKLRVNADSLTYIWFTVFLRSLLGFPAARVFKLILRSARTFKAVAA